jgi:hypothetical protein
VITYLERLKAKIQGKPIGQELSKLPKAPSHLETHIPQELSKLPKAPRYPFGYTELELEEARLDAERLGYGLNRKLH